MAAEWSRIVFLGPSLPLDQAKAILPDAEFRPPIKRDDLTAIPAGSIVGIIDGLLAKSLAISPGGSRYNDDIADLVDELRIIADLEGVDQMGFEPERLPDPAHR